MDETNSKDLVNRIYYHSVGLLIGFIFISLTSSATFLLIFLFSLMISFNSGLLSLVIFAIFCASYFLGKRLLKNIEEF